MFRSVNFWTILGHNCEEIVSAKYSKMSTNKKD